MLNHKRLKQKDLSHLIYLESPEWKAIQSLVVERDESCCQRCKGWGNEAYPKVFGDWQNPNPESFHVLCINCRKVQRAVQNGAKSGKNRNR